LLFDNRTDFLQGFGSMTYLMSPRLSFTVGGDGFYVHRQSKELIGMEGYTGRGQLQYRVSRVTTIGGRYERSHYQYPSYFGQSDFNTYTAFLATRFSPLWTFRLEAGAYQVSTQGLTVVALDPAVAAILGASTITRTFSGNDWLPQGRATLERKFRQATLSFNYSRMMAPGNGVYLTSRAETGGASINYLGIRRFSLDLGGGYTAYSSLGQGLPPYRTFTGSLGIAYSLTHALHAIARYDLRQQEITIAGFRNTSYRISLGLAFSPGTLPLSLW